MACGVWHVTKPALNIGLIADGSSRRTQAPLFGTINMSIFRPDLLIAWPPGTSFDDESQSIRWDDSGARIILSCAQFQLDQYPHQMFWSYTIHVTLTCANSDVAGVSSQAIATAQSLSDQRVLPTLWNFSVDTEVICEQSAFARRLRANPWQLQALVYSLN